MPLRGPANASVKEPQLSQLQGVIDIAAVKQHGHTHQTTNAGEIGLAKLLPLGDKYQCISTFNNAIRRGAQPQLTATKRLAVALSQSRCSYRITGLNADASCQ